MNSNAKTDIPKEEEETPVKPKRLKLKYKPRDFKEALLLKRLEEGDEQLIRQITDEELYREQMNCWTSEISQPQLRSY